MAEQIGELIPTKIASLSETADIQEAFRLYHYGAPSGTNIGDYDPTNTNPANLVQPSIAYSLQFLNDQVTFLNANLGVQPSQWTAKGALVTATAASTVSTLTTPANSNSFVLTVDSTTATGLKWSQPEVTLSNIVELLNKTVNLAGNTLTGTLAQFNAALSDDDFVSITGTETLTNKTLTAPALTTPTMNSPTVSDALIKMDAGLPDLDFAVTNNESATYVIDGAHNPTLNLVKGRTYTFNLNSAPARKFWLQTVPAPYSAANVITTGITNNGIAIGALTYTVPNDGTTVVYYVDEYDAAMTGTINIVDTPVFTTTVRTTEATAARQILLPNASGTVITTGNLSDIVSLGQIGSIYATGPIVGHPNVYSEAGTLVTLVATFDGAIVTTTSTDPVTVSIPGDNLIDGRQNHPIGAQVTVIQRGAGQITFVGNGGAEVNGTPGLKMRAQYASATCIKVDTNKWIVSGDLVA